MKHIKEYELYIMNSFNMARSYYIKNKCGNGVVEEGEECDSRPEFEDPEGICGKDCKFIPPAVCLPSNDICCDMFGQILQHKGLCLKNQLSSCKKSSFCNGVDRFCPLPDLHLEGTICGEEKECSIDGYCKMTVEKKPDSKQNEIYDPVFKIWMNFFYLIFIVFSKLYSSLIEPI